MRHGLDLPQIWHKNNPIKAFLCDDRYVLPALNQLRIPSNSTWSTSDWLKLRSLERLRTQPTPVRHQSGQTWCFVGVLQRSAADWCPNGRKKAVLGAADSGSP